MDARSEARFAVALSLFCASALLPCAPATAPAQEFVRSLDATVREDFNVVPPAPDAGYDNDIDIAVQEILYLADKSPALDRPSAALKREKSALALILVPAAGRANLADAAESKRRIEAYKAEVAAVQAEIASHLDNAIRHLRDAHRLHPERGLPIQYEGVAYLGARQYQRALYRFTRACAISLAHTGHLQPQLLLGVADASTGLGYYLEADWLYRRIIANYPDQPTQVAAARAALEANEHEWQNRRGAPKKGPFTYDVTADPPEIALPPVPALLSRSGVPFAAGGYVFTGFGYNDNLNRYPGRAASGTRRLRPGERDAGFYNESSFSLSLDSRPFPRRYLPAGDDFPQVIADTLSLNYVLVADTFGAYRADDLILQTGYVSYTRPLSDSFALSLKLSDQWLYLAQNLTQNKAVQQVGVNYTTAGGTRLQLSYYLQRLDGFADPAGAARITDGFAHRVELVGSTSLVSDRNDNVSTLTAQAQYAHLWNNAVGAYNRYQLDDVLALVSWMPWHAHASDPFPLLRNATFTFSNEWQPSSYVFAVARTLPPLRVDADTVTVGLSLKMLYSAGAPSGNRLEALMQWQHTFTGADIPTRIYQQNVYFSTLKINF